MSLRDALAGDKEYALRFDDYKVYFTLRRPTSLENLEFRRRSSKVAMKNKAIESSDLALNASLWLFEKVKVKAEYSNGSDERKALEADDYQAIDDTVKLYVINQHLSAITGEEIEAEKN